MTCSNSIDAGMFECPSRRVASVSVCLFDHCCMFFGVCLGWNAAAFLLTFSKWLSFNVNSYLTNMRQNVNAKTTIIQLETARCSQLNFIFGVLLSTIIGCNQIEPSNKFIRIWSVLFGTHDIWIVYGGNLYNFH